MAARPVTPTPEGARLPGRRHPGLRHLLVPGANVLAIHAMNAEPNSSDLLVNVELVRR
jgi:hypothetical protein